MRASPYLALPNALLFAVQGKLLSSKQSERQIETTKAFLGTAFAAVFGNAERATTFSDFGGRLCASQAPTSSCTIVVASSLVKLPTDGSQKEPLHGATTDLKNVRE